MKFPSIRIEGAILAADILDKIESGEVVGQKAADFGLANEAKVKDEIVRAWADAQDLWRIFRRKLDGLKPDTTATTETRNFFVVPFLGLLGYQLERAERGEVLNDKNYLISHRVPTRDAFPVHIMGWRDSLDRKREDSGPRMSPHALVQEYLNLTEHLYALVTNGQQLRLLRDSSRLIKLSYLEFDLRRIFEEELFPDFALLYRLLHVSRMPVSQATVAESIIERYHQDSLDSGSRIRDGLSKAVEQSILSLSNGFLNHPRNEKLRALVYSTPVDSVDELQSRSPFAKQFYQWQLRLIYRLLFLMVIEERDLIYPKGADRKKKEIYYRYYSLNRLRKLAERRHLADKNFEDAWAGLKATFRLFEADGPGAKLEIAPLAGDLFDPSAIGQLNDSSLDNAILLECFRNLSTFEHPDSHQRIRVNYGALNVEEFGSVYEGLLEYDPVITKANDRLEFAFVAGESRSASGSHYTPDELVQPLIQHSLDYLIDDKLKEKDQEKALLSLRVCDVACGSGHILLNAARRIGTELAVVRTGDDQPSPTAFREAVRDVIRHCIYGMDLNPLAVELCKVALWLEAHVPGQPLNFLDHRVKCGNAIVGLAHRAELQRGIPDEAFKTLPGDDKDLAAALRKQNKEERKGQQSLNFAGRVQDDLRALDEAYRAFEQTPEHGATDYQARRASYEQFRNNLRLRDLRLLADAQVAQFYLPKTPENRGKHITHDTFSRWMEGVNPTGPGIGAAMSLAQRKRFGHWFLEFWDVVDAGGFDLIIGNPPYLGRKLLSGTFGYSFCEWVKWEYAPASLSDIVAYFLRRIYDLMRDGGFAALITTNSIKDGDVRADGLEQVIKKGGNLNFVVSGTKWPGIANLYVSLLSIHKGTWANKPRILDGREVPFINGFFEGYQDAGKPMALAENSDRMLQGSIFLGDGFLLTHAEASEMKSNDSNLKSVIFPALNGKEVNSDPLQAPGRQIINFFDWPLERAAQFGKAFERVEKFVKPVRAEDNRALYRERWWQYAEPRRKLARNLVSIKKCFVTSWHTKHLNFSVYPSNLVFTNAVNVFTSDNWGDFAVVQSTIHEVWARKYSGALETRLRYSPTDCFLTFAFPSNPPSDAKLAAIGETYHEHRRTLMRDLWLGLTDLYNLFHTRDLEKELTALFEKRTAKGEWQVAEGVPTDHKPLDIYHSPIEALQGIQRLRDLHRELDQTVLTAYGWHADSDFGPALALRHDFYDVDYLPENDRTRYTIHPDARRELLARLLKLNHQRAAAAESAEKQAAIVAPTVKKPKAKPVPVVELAPRRHSRGINFTRGAIASYAVDRLGDRWEFGRTQMEKVLYLAQQEIGINLEMEFQREAAGPFDEEIHKLESLAAKEGWFLAKKRSGDMGTLYQRGPKIADRCGAAASILGAGKTKFDSLLDWLAKMKTAQVELLATVHAVWNGFIIEHQPVTDALIIQGVYDWHPSKARFTREQIQSCINWLVKHQFVPRGIQFETRQPDKPKEEVELTLDLFSQPAPQVKQDRILPTGKRTTLGGIGYAIQLVRALLSESEGTLTWPRLVDAFTLATQPALMCQKTASADAARVKAWSKRWKEVLPPGALLTAIEQLGSQNLAARRTGQTWTISLKDGPKPTASDDANYDAWLALRVLGAAPVAQEAKPTLVIPEFDDWTKRMETMLVA